MLKITINRFKALFFMKFSVSLFIAIFFVTLSGCSPHPGTGKWQADGDNSLNISTINILFEGNADFYTAGKEESIRRCFWSAIAEQTIKMQCVYSEDSQKKILYQFVVSKKGHATLSQDKQLIGQFKLQAPEKEASFY